MNVITGSRGLWVQSPCPSPLRLPPTPPRRSSTTHPGGGASRHDSVQGEVLHPGDVFITGHGSGRGVEHLGTYSSVL